MLPMLPLLASGATGGSGAAGLFGGLSGLVGDGGLGGIIGGILGGGKTEVNQSVSQSSNSVVGISLTNNVGAGDASGAGVSIPVTQSPTSSAFGGNDPAPSGNPVYGQTWGTNYQNGDISRDIAAEQSPVLAGFNPLFVVPVLGVALWFMMKEKN